MKKNIAKPKILLLISALIIIITFIFTEYNSYKVGMNYFINKYQGMNIIHKSDYCVVLASENDFKDRISVKSIRYTPFPFSVKNNTMSYNPQIAYVSDYQQTHFRYILRKCEAKDISSSPAVADQGYISWFNKRTILPSFTVTEIEYHVEKDIDCMNLKTLELSIE